MSGKQFLVLLLLFAAYLMLGAAVFHYIEQAKEIDHNEQERRTEKEIYTILQANLQNDTLLHLIPKLESYCGKTFNIDPGRPDPFKWHFYNAVFFVITVVSTIGYGNLAPTTPLSRILMIFYALVGIPLNGILLKCLADYFGNFFLRARDKYRTHRHDAMSLAGSVLLYMSLGIFVFIVSPSFLFMYFERWTFDEAIYFAFVTLSTIGFGDLVAGQDSRKGHLYMLYKLFLIVWVVFGLGYLVMVLSFISDAMRSKRMAKLSKGIRHTQTRLWNGVVHEMPHLMRRVLNELYLLKVKPVYHGDDASLVTLQMDDRCASCPDLFWLAEQGAHPYPVAVGVAGAGGRRWSRTTTAAGRPRALSEVLPSRLMARRRSETELARIDRRATFADTAAPTDSALDPAELLHEFMNALVNWGGGVGADEVYSTMHKAPGTALPNGGYQGFADADIMSSEWSQQQQQQQQQRQQRQRQRAKSLAPFSAATEALAESRYGYGAARPWPRPQGVQAEEDGDDSSTLPADEAAHHDAEHAADSAEWTWSGTGASKRVHELIRARQNRRRSEAFIRKQQRQDRRMQELHDFQRLRAFEEMQQQDRLRAKQLRARTMSAGSVEPGASVPRTSASGLMQRLAIPQRLKDLKDLAMRRRSLQPDEQQDGPPAGEKRRSPSYDPASPPAAWASLAASDAYHTHSAGDNLLGPGGLGGLGGLGAGLGTGRGRRDSVFRRNSATVHPVLENTSLAEFLRVLQSVQRQQGAGSATVTGATPAAPATPGKTRKLGTAGLAQPSVGQPSIFNVFPGLLDGVKPEKRRLSLRPGSPPPGATSAPFVGPAQTVRRRMSFWPSFGSDHVQPPQPTNGLTVAPAGGHRKSCTARRLSTFFGGGTCTDPASDQDDGDAVSGAPIFSRVIKRRRFSIWPALGAIGRAGGSADRDAGERAQAAQAAEDGRSADVAAPGVPQITVTYVNDVPPRAPREALLRMALGKDSGPRLGRTSLGGAAASPSPPQPGRRGPSTPSPLSTPVAAYRRRAMSDSAQTRPLPAQAEAQAAEAGEAVQPEDMESERL